MACSLSLNFQVKLTILKLSWRIMSAGFAFASAPLYLKYILFHPVNKMKGYIIYINRYIFILFLLYCVYHIADMLLLLYTVLYNLECSIIYYHDIVTFYSLL